MQRGNERLIGEELSRGSYSVLLFFLSLSWFGVLHRAPRISQKGTLIEAAAVNADLLRPPPSGNESSHRVRARTNEYARTGRPR